jgi:hypothetical protein
MKPDTSQAPQPDKVTRQSIAKLNEQKLRQLRAQLECDLADEIPAGYFEQPPELPFHNSLQGREFVEQHASWGYRAAKLALDLNKNPTRPKSPRAVAANAVFVNVGALEAARALEWQSKQLAAKAHRLGVTSPEGLGASIESVERGITILEDNIRKTLRDYLVYLSPAEQAPFLGLVADTESEAKQATKAALNYSSEVFKKAWQRLRSDGRIKDA